jgi:asparagine synthetase B (glutamine-hydrolysing)
LVPTDPPEYNVKSIVSLFTFMHLLGNDTFFEGIELLPPASVLVYNVYDHSIHISSYWSYDLEDKPAKFAHLPLEWLIEKFDAAMANSIRWRMGDHENIGIFLSGGIDSRILIGYAKELADKTNKRLHAFTFGTKNGYQHKPTCKVAKALGIKHSFYEIPADTIAKYAWEVVWNGDGHLMIRDAHFISLLQTIREGVDVVLTGYIGGILFGAHVTEAILKFSSKRELLDYKFERAKVGPMSDKAPSLFMDSLVSDFELSARESFEATINSIPSEVPYKVAYYWDLYQRGMRFLMPNSNYPRWYVFCSDAYVDNALLDFASSLPAELLMHKRFLRKVLEMRFPQLNDLGFEEAPPLRASDWERFLFRLIRYAERRLVFAIQECSRGKILIRNRNYRAYDYWLRTDSKEFVKEILSDSFYYQGLFLKQSAVEKILEEHLICKEDYNLLICDVLNLIMMHRYFVNQMPGQQQAERTSLP